jgi:hypothetical protein
MSTAAIESDSDCDLLDLVRTDPDTQAFERETSIRYDGEADLATIYSGQRSQIQGCLRHDHFSLGWLSITTDHRHYQADTESDARALIEDHEDAWITGIEGTLPIGCVSIKAAPRSTDEVRRVISV